MSEPPDGRPAVAETRGPVPHGAKAATKRDQQVVREPAAPAPDAARDRTAAGGVAGPDAPGRPAGTDAPAPPTVVMPQTSAPPGATPAAAGRDPEAARWAQLQSQFVDDPAAAVRGASDLVQEAVQRLLRRTGEGDGDTEGLRTAFLRYRDLHRTLIS